MTHAAVFLDKDGTLVENIPYNVDPALVRFAPGVAEGAAALHAAGYLLVVVSNQSGVARGFFNETALVALRESLESKLAAVGAPLAGFYYCPHHPEGIVSAFAIDCECRKPRAGMFSTAAAELNIDLERSWLIGDILDDVEAGRAAGCRTVLIDNGHETEWDVRLRRLPEFLAEDFSEAADYILARPNDECESQTVTAVGAAAATKRRTSPQSANLRAARRRSSRLFAFPPLLDPRKALAFGGRSR